MKTSLVSGHEAEDIQNQVRKVLRGLGNPEPPLRLDDVRELLRLDRQYYKSTDDGVLREFVSRMQIAGKQVLSRPMLVIDAIRKWDLSALWVPDQKRILIDADKPKLKWRWNEAHEIGHSIIPWHSSFLHGDDQATLRFSCHETIESEANYAAGQLTFLQNRFVEDARSVAAPSIDQIKTLAKRYGNTVTSTFWRFVEEAQNQPMVGLVTDHPHRLSDDFDHQQPCKHFIQSPKFQAHFHRVSEVQLFAKVSDYCGHQRGGMLGSVELRLMDDNGDNHVFEFQSFSNTFEVLTLGIHKTRCQKTVVI